MAVHGEVVLRPRVCRSQGSGRCSGFARTATAGSAIAARLAARKLDAGNVVLPTGATKGVWRAGSIIATANMRTGNVTRRLA